MRWTIRRKLEFLHKISTGELELRAEMLKHSMSEEEFNRMCELSGTEGLKATKIQKFRRA